MLTEDELQSDTASCMSIDPSVGRVVSIVDAKLEQVPTPVIGALHEDLTVPRRHRRLVLGPASSHDRVEPTAVDSPAESPSDSGYSANVDESCCFRGCWAV